MYFVPRTKQFCGLAVSVVLLLIVYISYQAFNEMESQAFLYRQMQYSPSQDFLNHLSNNSLPFHHSDAFIPMLNAVYYTDYANDQLKRVALLILDADLSDHLSTEADYPGSKRFDRVKMGTPDADIEMFAKYLEVRYSDSFNVKISRNVKGLVAAVSVDDFAGRSLSFHSIRRLSSYWYIHNLMGDHQDAVIPVPKLARYQINNLVMLGHEQPRFYAKLLRASRLMDCNHTSAALFANQYKNVTRTINPSQFEGLAILQEKMYDLGAIPFICSGTLLGWYRECSLIPYTSDMDIGIKLEEWSHNLTDLIYRDKRFSFYWILGEVSDSLEYTVFYQRARIDIFLFYHDNSSFWVGGMIPSSHKKLRYDFPLFIGDPCAAVLMGYLFHIPCRFLDFLNAEYGTDWLTPVHQSRYIWYHSPRNVKILKTYSKADWDVIYRNTTDKILTFKDLPS